MSSRTGPIIIIEDDPDDQEWIRDAIGELGVPNEMKFFNDCLTALSYLMETRDKPLLIICDINLPVMDGMQFRRKICEIDYIRMKSIPFIFLSTTATQQSVEEAYRLMVQGFFEKQNNHADLKRHLGMIIDYWRTCRHPNSDNS